VAPPFREAEVDIVFGRGIDRLGDLVSIASDLGVVEKSGSWFSFEQVRLGQGKERAVEFLGGNPEVEGRVRARVMEALALGGAPHRPAGDTTPEDGDASADDDQGALEA
jgi:recombination protein RecA